MKTQLVITFHLVDHPYPESPGSQFEVWGQIDMNLDSTANAIEIPLLSIQWNIALFAEWFVDKWLSIYKEELGSDSIKSLILPSESIAEAMQRLQAREFPDSEDADQFNWFSSLFEFRESHSLRFALRGTDIPEIFIGYNHSQGEISVANASETWSYPFEMNSFCSHTKENLQAVLKEWLHNSQNPAANERIQDLITRLSHTVTSS